MPLEDRICQLGKIWEITPLCCYSLWVVQSYQDFFSDCHPLLVKIGWFTGNSVALTEKAVYRYLCTTYVAWVYST